MSDAQAQEQPGPVQTTPTPTPPGPAQPAPAPPEAQQPAPGQPGAPQPAPTESAPLGTPAQAGPAQPQATPAQAGDGQWAQWAPALPTGRPPTAAQLQAAHLQAAPQWPMQPPPPLFPDLTRRWPGPAVGAGPAVLGGALATGVATAVSVPLDRAGVGWLVAAVVAAGAVAVVAGTTGRTGGRAGLARLGWLLATVCLVGAGTVRAADWLTVLCLLTAAGTAALAITEGRDVRGMVLGVLAVPAAAFRAPRWGARGLSRLRGDRGGTAARGAAAVAVTAVLLIVFGALFASADAAFARLTGAVTPDLEVASAVRWVFLFAVGSVALLAAAYLLVAPPDLGGLKRAATARLSRWEWALPVAALDGLFAVFVAVQFTVLFGGAEHVLGSDGPSFAQYARGGFWQLLVVTLLTLAVLAAVGRWAPRATRRDRVLLRALLGALAGMALVVVASALYRMHIYEEAYGFTRLRVLVSACEVWLGAVFVLVLAAGVRLRAGWLPRAVVGTAVAALLGLVALNPDRFIAERNIERYVHTQRLDVWYLGTLSADAAPALVELSPALRACTLEHLPAELALTDGDWRYWNLARSRARALLAEKPVGSPEPLDCMTR